MIRVGKEHEVRGHGGFRDASRKRVWAIFLLLFAFTGIPSLLVMHSTELLTDSQLAATANTRFPASVLRMAFNSTVRAG